MSTVQMETLVGRKVRDLDGKIAGRLEEVHADWRGDECIVTHYVIASSKARRGLHWTLIAFVLRFLGAEKSGGGLVVPWDRLDLRTMRLNCRVDDLVG